MTRKEADSIIRQFQTTAPVDVVGAARALGLSVYKAELSPGISGVLKRDDKRGGPSGFMVLVREGDPFNRQRFTIAHEIGHFVLHRNNAEAGIEDDEFYRALPGPLERQANEYAADILMPWELINRFRDQGVVRLDQMSQALGVSKQALAIRLGLPYDENWN